MSNKSRKIIFIVIVVVIYLAAVLYSFASLYRGDGEIDKDNAEKLGSQMFQYGASVSQTVTRLMTVNGCTEAQISWQAPQWSDQKLYENPNSPSDGRCNIYSENGGGVSWSNPPINALSALSSAPDNPIGVYFYDSRRYIIGIGKKGSRDTKDGSEWLLRAQVTKEVCRAINKNVRGTVSIPSDDFPYNGIGGDISAPAKSDQASLGENASCPECRGEHAMCFLQLNGTNPVHQFYYVVMAR